MKSMLDLRGVFLEDLCERPSEIINIKIITEKLPNKIFDIKDWPKKSELECMQCGNNPLGHPIPIASSLIKNEETMGFERYGIYCSFSCASFYIDNCMDDELGNKDLIRRKELQDLLKLLYEKFYDKKVSFITYPPKKKELMKHGGNMTTFEYQSELM